MIISQSGKMTTDFLSYVKILVYAHTLQAESGDLFGHSTRRVKYAYHDRSLGAPAIDKTKILRKDKKGTFSMKFRAAHL